ncbi:MAG: hypothetical protein V3W20_05225 [Candidatus Neomarinimicrobiota bacterium]
MNNYYDILLFLHVISFVFMSVPLFNLIVVNERVALGPAFNYSVDRYMENIIKHGSYRCFVFQLTILVTGLLLLVTGPLGIAKLFSNWILITKTIWLFVLTGMLSYVHFYIQPKIESLMTEFGPESKIPDDLVARLKPFRVRRKKMATFCLFSVISLVILGLQVYDRFDSVLTIILIALAGLFSLRVNKTLIRFGWL